MRAEISPPTYLHPSAMLGSKTKERTTQETQGLYWFGPPLWCNTLLQCVVWWIASWADDDEQYKEEQPREGLFLAGAMNCWEEFSHLSLSLSMLPTSLSSLPFLFSNPFALWEVGPIYRGPGPLPKY